MSEWLSVILDECVSYGECFAVKAAWRTDLEELSNLMEDLTRRDRKVFYICR